MKIGTAAKDSLHLTYYTFLVSRRACLLVFSGLLLNVSGALAVSPFIFVLMFLVGSFDGSGAVAGFIRVENPYIKIIYAS